MHFTTLFILKGEKLENISLEHIKKIFRERFCYNCGETKPKYQNWCDWFQIGGRWCDLLKAKEGLYGERSWTNEKETPSNGKYSVVEIKDLIEEIPRNNIYSVATKSRIYLKNDDWNSGEVNPEKFNQLLDDIDNKKFNGVIALIDCHD